MDIPDDLLTLFSATVEEVDGSYVIEVPNRELAVGDIEADAVYQIAFLPGSAASQRDGEPATPARRQHDRQSGPPVSEGDQRTVEIEDIGDQGDGLARVDQGYIVIVPEVERGERVTIEITTARENVAFSEVVERHAYYE